MEIREIREGDVLVLAPDGSVTGTEDTAAIEGVLATSLKANFRHLVLDCAAVAQLTSAAIRVLLLTSRKLERTEGRLVLCAMNAKLAKAFSISGFDRDFTVVATREEAVRRVLEPAPRRPPKKERTSPARPVLRAEPEPAPAPPAEVASASESPAPVSETAPVVAVESPAAPEPPASEPGAPVLPTAAWPPAADDPRLTVAAALLGAMGVKGAGADVVRPTRSASLDLEALADGMLAALRAGRA